MVTTLKNTAKPVTDLPFPAITICASGLHMDSAWGELCPVEEEEQQDREREGGNRKRHRGVHADYLSDPI